MSAARQRKLVSDCNRALNLLMDKYSVRLCCFPGYSSVGGSEIVNELARIGSALDGGMCCRFCEIPIVLSYRVLSNWVEGQQFMAK